jgi:CRP-like cAMP-binding protein
MPGMTFAQSGSFFSLSPNEGLEYKACSNSKVLRLPREVFLSALKTNRELCDDYISALLRNQVYLIERIVYQAEKGVYAKSIRWLLFMAKFYGEQKDDCAQLRVPITQEIAANFMHITRESAASALGKLKKKQLIAFKNKCVTITSLKGLENELY